jgi:[ribosomal protein S5]-alanine N-acetyltransferase
MGPRRDLRLVPWESFDPTTVLNLYLRNRAHLSPWEPAHPPDYYSIAGQRARSLEVAAGRAAGREATYGIVEESTGALVGRVALTRILRGPLQSAHLGYLVDADHCRRGYATEAVRQMLAVAFTELRLHRVEAAVMPRNAASLRVVARAGFREEGLARGYLCINGVWEDHRIFARTAEDEESP